MAQNITLMGASFSAVPAVTLPKTGGGTARFDDASITTATASDVASGKLFLAADGTITTGTNSGGGGSPWTLLGSSTINVNTSSTTASAVGTIDCGAAAYTATNVILVHIRSASGKRAGYFYGSDVIFINSTKANGSTSTFSAGAAEYIRVSTSGAYATTASTASGCYGVYAYSITNAGVVTIRGRYHSSNSLTVNDDFVVKVYALALPSGDTLFT